MKSKLIPITVAIIALSMSGFAQPPDDGEGPPPPPPDGAFFMPPPPDDMGPPPDMQDGQMAPPQDNAQPDAGGQQGGRRSDRQSSRRPRGEAAPLPPMEDTSSTLSLSKLPPAAKEMSFNFRGVPADDVLEAMSKTLGLAIVKSVQLTGNVNVVSHQPLNTEDAVALLNTIIDGQGYTGILNGRTLTIVRRDEARTKSIPVRRGADPEKIPDNTQMVTQIIPVKHASVKELVPQLEALIPSYATMTANESTNAIVLTDTQSGVKHIAEIIQALDESISEISQMHVYPLDYSDATEVAATITKLFEPPSTSTSGRGGGGGGPFGGNFFRRDDNNSSSASPNSSNLAMQANSRVVAVADVRTNSLIISAPDALTPAIESLVQGLDHDTDVLTDVRVFPLKNANATEMTTVITGIFAPNQATAQSRNGRQQNVQQRFGGFGQQRQGNTGTTTASTREQTQSTVLAVADTRTNSLIISAAPSSMDLIANVVKNLDASSARTKRVYVYPLKNADPSQVSTMLQGMFGATGSANSRTGARSTTNGSSARTNGTGSNTTNRNNTSGNRTNNNSSR
ncbi:hypothetical protein BH09SUM1_BH09SUM1_14910 [soil metagenome]